MRQPRLLKVSLIIITVALAFAAIGFTVGIIAPGVYMDGIFGGYTGRVWSEFAKQQPEQARLYEHIKRTEECFGFLTSLLCFFVLFAGYRSGKKWAWLALLLAAILGSGTVLVFGIMFSDPVGITLGIAFACLCLIGLLIPVKEIWSGSSGNGDKRMQG